MGGDRPVTRNLGLFVKADDSVYGKLRFHKRSEVNVFIPPEVMRVPPEELHYFYHYLEHSVGKAVEVQLLWSKGRAGLGILLRVTRDVESQHGSFVNSNMVGVAIAADGVRGYHHFRLNFAE